MGTDGVSYNNSAARVRATENLILRVETHVISRRAKKSAMRSAGRLGAIEITGHVSSLGLKGEQERLRAFNQGPKLEKRREIFFLLQTGFSRPPAASCASNIVIYNKRKRSHCSFP